MVLAQFAHESGNFIYTHEIDNGKGRSYGRPSGPYGKVYYGRGPIQITWEANYKQITQKCFPKIGITADIHKDPDLCCRNLEIGCAASLCWFMLSGNGKSAIAAANAGDVRALTKAINGGYNGLQDRVNNTNKILAQNTDYKKETINNEFSFIKMVAAQSMEDINLANQNNNTNLGNNNENSANIQENSINADKNTTNTELAEAQTNVSVEVLPSNVSNKYTHEIFGVQLKNESDYNLSAEITDLNIDFNKNEIMIFHTHTCESYTPTEQYQYQASGNFRTTDLNYSVARVGDELEKYLKEIIILLRKIFMQLWL